MRNAPLLAANDFLIIKVLSKPLSRKITIKAPNINRNKDEFGLIGLNMLISE
jgi:hypothetical protein